MSAQTDTTSGTPVDQADERLRDGRGLVLDALDRLRGGDIGSFAVVIGLGLICVIFQILNPVFLSSRNLVEMTAAAAPIGIISLGVVVTLLVGEIDLSVGSMSGVASAIIGVGLVGNGLPLGVTLLLALASGAVVGLLYGGLYVGFSVPSFVVTLAGLLALLGLQLYILGTNGSINIPFSSPLVGFSQRAYLPAAATYVVAIGVGVAIFASRMARRRRRANHDLSVESSTAILTRATVVTVLLLAAGWYLNQDRGVAAPFVLFVGLSVVMHFALTRTRWGRSVYAVGGSEEASRRSGIPVNRIYVSVFVLCSVLAALGGVLGAGRLATASISSGTGATNLNAIAAAVIGGTSLFGGRGGSYSALLGTAVIGAIASGLILLNLDSSVRFMITGGVLLIAVIVDSISRRSRAAHGRA